MNQKKITQYVKVATSMDSDEWGTPLDLFNKLNKKYNFTLDAAANDKNYKCKKYYTKENSGLTKDWTNERVFCNPPYSDLGLWIKKCYVESKNAKLIVMLIPCRTDTKNFHKYIWNIAEIIYIKGRLKFTNDNGKSKGSAPFPSMIVIYTKYIKITNQIKLF
tara:strand:+ start:1971 stop:2456 length:486 start_codon:yes stop_codon:yes gene_type:complete